MNTTTADDAWKFSPVAVVRQAWAVVTGNLLLFFSWGWLPLALRWAVAVCTPADVQGYQAFPLARGLAWVLVSWVSFWLMVPLWLRVYRFVILDERPATSYGLQLWEGRTWRYIGCSIKAAIVLQVVGLALMLVPVGLAMYVLHAHGYADSSPLYTLLVYQLTPIAGGLAGFLALAAAMTLVYPAAAADGPTSLVRLGALGARAKWRMAKTMLMILGAAALLDTAASLAGYLQWGKGTSLPAMAQGVIIAIELFLTLMSIAAAGLIYKRLSPLWGTSPE